MLIPNNKALKDKLAKDEYELVLTLSNTTLTNQSIPNSKILQDSFSVNRFSVTGGTIEVGSATAAEMQVTIDNSDGSFDDWTFEGATIFARLKATISGTAEYMDIGYFIVDEVVRQRDSIQLVCLDKMVWFDKAIVWSVEPNDGGFVFSTSPATLLSNICSACNVSYNSASFTANAINKTVTLAAPTSENLTYRQLLQWLCQVIGVCAYINESGALIVAWYAQKTYSGEDAEDRAAQDIITPSNRFSSTIDRDPITISNVSVKVGETTYAANSNNTYTLAIEGNELIDETNYASILSSLATRLVGFSYYPFTADVLGLQWLQPLDITTFVDKDDVEHTVIITDWTYSRGRNTQLAGKGESATRKGYASNPPFTAAQQRIIEEIKKNTPEVDIDDRIEAVFALNNAVNSGMMLHSTTIDGKVYYHNAATLADSDLIATANTGGFAWTTSGWNSGNPSWSYGISNDGAAVLQTLSTYSLNADLINAGQIDASQIDVVNLDASNITTGTLQDAAQKNTINFANGSFSLGNGNIVYDAVNNTFSINSSVVIGAAQQAVEDVLSNQLVEYAVSESGTTPPSDGNSHSQRFFYSSETSISTTDVYNIFSVAENWSDAATDYYDWWAVQADWVDWGNSRPYLYSFLRTEHSDESFDITDVRFEGTFGGSSDDEVYSATVYLVSETDYTEEQATELLKSSTNDNLSQLSWPRGSYLYSGYKTLYADGSIAISNYDKISYGSGDSSVILSSNKFWFVDSVDTVDSSYANTLNSNWFTTSIRNKRVRYDCFPNVIFEYWTSTNKYLKSLTRIKYEDGSSTITGVKLEATYNVSYPDFDYDPWSTTMPSIADNKGKYLWTRTSYDERTTWTYSVNYIGNDGASGQDGDDGRGIQSIVTKYAVNNDTQNAPTGSAWKDLPSQAIISASNPYLWTKTITTYTSGSPATSETSPAIIGHYGQDSSGQGAPGKGISKITPQYALSTSNSTEPQSGWQDTVPEYPTTVSPTASGTLSSSLDSATTVLSNLNLIGGTTYAFSATLDKNGISGTRFDIENANGTSISGFPMNGSSTTSGNVTPSVSGVYHVTFTPKQAHTYKASLNGNDLTVKYYYWQRDKIEWDDGSADTYTGGVLSTGFNAAIFGVNRLNPLFAEVYLDGSTQVMFDAGHIYANSLTAYSVAAYEAFIRNLMANYVKVDGNVDVINGDITITQSAANITEDDMDQTYLDTFCQQRYNKTYAQLSPFIQPFAFMLAVSSYLSSVSQSAANAGKLVVQNNNNATKKSTLYPNLLLFYDSSNSKYAYYGYDAFVHGNAKINGNLTAGNIQKGIVDVQLDSNGEYTVTVPFDKEFDNPPCVTVTPGGYIKSLNAVIEISSTTSFRVSVKKLDPNEQNLACVLYWTAIS